MKLVAKYAAVMAGPAVCGAARCTQNLLVCRQAERTPHVLHTSSRDNRPSSRRLRALPASSPRESTPPCLRRFYQCDARGVSVPIEEIMTT